jgi:DNA-cytosine methyltransferase
VAQKEGEKEMKVLSLFSGVGGFDLGLERAGMETVFQCEWDKHATSILERHWPDTPRWTDVSTLTGAYVLQHAPIIDVVAWGSPCQDLSVAGKRAGLGGERSGLFHEGIRIIKEIREITNGQYPRFSIWENVAGALSSSNGADFGEVLYEMDEAGACFSEWRLLDAQYFGVPQRRRRVFVISVFDSATAARCPNPLLPVCESVRRDIEAGGTEREEPTGTVEQSLASGSDIANTISAELYHRSTVVNQDVNNGHLGVGSSAVEPFTPSSFAQYEQGVGTLRSNGGDLGGGSETLVTFTKAKRAQTSTDDETWVEGKPAPTLNAFDQGDTRATTVVVGDERTYRDVTGALLGRDSFGPNHEGARDGKPILEPILIDGRRVDDVRVYDPPVQTLQARMGTGGNNVPVIGFSHTQGLSAQPSEIAWPTLRQGGAGHAVAYDEYNDTLGGDVHHALRAGTKQSTGVVVDNEIVGTLRSGGDGGVPSSRGEHLVVAPSLTASNDPSRSPQSAEITQQVTAIHQATMAVRRLTPVECERLMGWPDGWTEGQADTHRYKQCGNGVASPVATWIGQQLINL